MTIDDLPLSTLEEGALVLMSAPKDLSYLRVAGDAFLVMFCSLPDERLALLASKVIKAKADAALGVERSPALHPLASVRRWRGKCCLMKAGAETPAGELHEAYMRWAETNAAPALTPSSFGRYLRRLGITGRKAGSTVYLGIRLRRMTDSPDPEQAA